MKNQTLISLKSKKESIFQNVICCGCWWPVKSWLCVNVLLMP